MHENLTDGQQALAYRLYEPTSFEVLRHTTRGFAYLNESTPVANQLARAAFAKALEIDEAHPGANAGMGYTYSSPMFFRWQNFSEEATLASEGYARKALEANPEFIPALNLLAVLELFRGNLDQGLEQIQAALKINASSTDSMAIYAYMLTFTDRIADAQQAATRAMQLRPYSYPDWYEWVFIRALRLNGQTEAALTCLAETPFTEKESAVAASLEAALLHMSLGNERKAQEALRPVRPYLGFDSPASQYCTWPIDQGDQSTEAQCSNLVNDLLASP